MENITETRKQFPITKSRVFLNHAAQSPLPKPTADAVHKCVNQASNIGETSHEWDDGGKPLFAELIGAKSEEIAFVQNTSTGMNIAAHVLHYPRGSKVVTTDLEFPSVIYPWLRKRLGVKIQYVNNVKGRILLDDLEKAVDDKTVAVAISHVEYVNGFRHNLRIISEIVHEHGAYLIADAIQSVGTMPIDVKRDDVDFLTASCYKWLLSPPGAGYLYVKEELIEEFEPPFVGWASVNQEVFETIDFWDIWNMKLAKNASRFETGSSSVLSIAGAQESMKLLLAFGMENVKRRILNLTDHLIDEVKEAELELQTPEDEQSRSGIVKFRVKKPQHTAQALGGKGIIISARDHGIRVSPHFYNTEEEIERLMKEIKGLN